MKSSKFLMAMAIIASAAALAGCQKQGTSSTGTSSTGTSSAAASSVAQTSVEKAIADAETLTQEQLFEKAAKELGASGQMKILATTSRGGKDAVKNAFIAKLQKYDASITAPLKYDTTVDGDIYTKLIAEINSGVTDGVSAAIVQDGYQLQTKGLDTKLFKNYVPKEWKEATGVDVTNDSNPFTLQYNFKTWMYNNKGVDTKIDNVWDVTASSFKGKIDTMNPNNENVNMTLATKVCLINNGVIQQYEPPLDVYHNPANLFVADFIGSPSINFVEVLAEQKGDDLSLTMFDDVKAEFKPNTYLNLKAFTQERDKEITLESEEKESEGKKKGFVEKENSDRAFNYHINKVAGVISSEEEHGGAFSPPCLVPNYQPGTAEDSLTKMLPFVSGGLIFAMVLFGQLFDNLGTIAVVRGIHFAGVES